MMRTHLIVALVVIGLVGIPAVFALWPWFWRHMVAACAIVVCFVNALTIWQSQKFSLGSMFLIGGSIAALLALAVMPHFEFVSTERITLRVVANDIATQRPIEGAIVALLNEHNDPIASGVTDDGGCVDLTCELYATTRRSIVRDTHKCHLEDIDITGHADDYLLFRRKLEEVIEEGGQPISLGLAKRTIPHVPLEDAKRDTRR